MFNKIDGDFDDVAISTFKISLSAEHGWRKSLTGKPVTNVRQLMDQIDKYKRVEEDQQQGKGNDKVIPQERRDFRVMFVAQLSAKGTNLEPKKARIEIQPILGSSDKDKIRTIKPHDDTLVVTLRIGGYDVKRVLVDQGSSAEIMYPNLYKGLNLRPEDLTAYNSPLVSFDGKVVIPKGQIRLSVQTGLEVVEVDFIVVDVYSSYTAIMARPWFHTLGVVSFTLHQKVKYLFEG
nr:uncharacterized protein LOC111983266 [Quercus suber]